MQPTTSDLTWIEIPNTVMFDAHQIITALGFKCYYHAFVHFGRLLKSSQQNHSLLFYLSYAVTKVFSFSNYLHEWVGLNLAYIRATITPFFLNKKIR